MRTLPCPSRGQACDQLSTGLKVRRANGRVRGFPITEAQLDEVMALYDAYDAAKGAPNELLKVLTLMKSFEQLFRRPTT